jgi:tRNA-splicing ligase RtcB
MIEVLLWFVYTVSMDINLLKRIDDYAWLIPASGKMRVPATIYADETLIRAMDVKVCEQISNVAALPGIVKSTYAMPDAHWGYGFPVGGIAAFDPEEAGIISAGGVGYDISCGVRTLITRLSRADVEPLKAAIADALFASIPCGVGSQSAIHLNKKEMHQMLENGAKWAVKQGYGCTEDLEYIEEQGCMAGADPDAVSDRAKERQYREMGTLGSGNHYLEVQAVDTIFEPHIAAAFGIKKDDVLVSIHCGSRGLGHQICTDYSHRMLLEAAQHKIELPDRDLACAPILSPLGQAYISAMRAGINCALANRQILTHFTRQVFEQFFPKTYLHLLYDVSHNTCREEWHEVEGKKRRLFVHRKGGTRAFGPGHPDIPAKYAKVGQPVLIGGSMGTASYILAGTQKAETQSFGSACHGAGRAMSRHAATKLWKGPALIKELARQGIYIRSPSMRGVAEEAPLAYKDVNAVIESADGAGLTKKVARLVPMLCIKG